MAYQVVWSSKALEDVEAIATYISGDSTAYAAAVVQNILDITRYLNNFPFSGRMWDNDRTRPYYLKGAEEDRLYAKKRLTATRNAMSINELTSPKS